jgi:predicted nucleic acid-binding protein
MKPKVYVETSVISYLTARASNDVRALAAQNITLEWWESQRPHFELFVSEFVVAEAAMGNEYAAQKRLAVIEGIAQLTSSADVDTLSMALIRRHALPANAEMDAFHVAIAAVNGIEYLLTWNCKHIANALTRPKIEATCRALGYEPPIICTPQELLET